MLRPLSSLNINPVFPVESGSPEMTPCVLPMVFCDVFVLGIDEIVKRCDERLSGNDCTEYCDTPWLVQLDRCSLLEVLHIINELGIRTNDIFAALKIDADRNQQITLSPQEFLTDSNSWQVFAFQGAIYFKDSGGRITPSPLMTFGQFFTMTRNSWRMPRNMTRMDFSGMDLSYLDFHELDLSRSSFNRASLKHANLDNTYCQHSDLSWADLSHASLRSVNFCESNLSYANFFYADLNSNEFSRKGTNLDSICDDDTNLNGTDLTMTNFYGAKFFFVSICGANLDGTNFSHTTLDWVLFHDNLRFNTANFFRASINLVFQSSAFNPDQLLNHLNNEESGTILTMIDAISDLDLRVSLMHQFINYVDSRTSQVGDDSDDSEDNSSESFIAEYGKSIMDIWVESCTDASHLKDPTIVSFIKERILTPEIKRANTSCLDLKTDSYQQREVDFYLDMVESICKEEIGKFMLDNNGFFIQLMLFCTHSRRGRGLPSEIVNIEARERRAFQLYDTYLSLPELAAGKKAMEMNAGNIRDEDKGLAFVIFKQVDNQGYTLLLEGQHMEDMLHNPREANWDMVYYMEGDNAILGHDRDATFSLFEFFESGWRKYQHKNILPAYLNTINFDYVNGAHKPDMLTKNYLELIQHAMKFPSLIHSGDKYNLTGEEDQIVLKNIFRRLLSENISTLNLDQVRINDLVQKDAKPISEKHFEAIVSALNLATASKAHVAKALFCFATIFTKLSSSYFFGREASSPEALREYAAGLLIKAYELDPTVFGSDERTQKANFIKWIQVLLGGSREDGSPVFSCTAVSSSAMFAHADKNFKEIMDAGIRPAGWF